MRRKSNLMETMETVLSRERLASARRRRLKQNVQGIAITVLPMIGFILFSAIPIVLSFFVSFTDINRTDTVTLDRFANMSLQNYVTLLTNPNFYRVLLNSAYFTLSVPLTMIFGLLIAVILNKHLRGKRFFRTIFFVPYVCSIVAVSITWKMMYEENYGIINTILASLGLEKVGWITDGNVFMTSLIIMSIWSKVGFCVILYQAALANVDKSYYDAARMDGAGGFRIFFRIEIPCISPTTFYLLTIKLISALQVMAEAQVMGGAHLQGVSGITAVYYLYNLGFVYNQSEGFGGFGIASAASWLLTIIILAITAVNFKLSDKWVHYDN